MAEQALKDIWLQRDQGMDLPLGDVLTTVAPTDIAYICNYIYPFIQLVNSAGNFEGGVVHFYQSRAGWTIHDYGDAISTSAPHILDAKAAEEGGDEGGKSGSGTNDQAITIEDIARLIIDKGWASVEIVAGSELMQKLLWVESKRYGFNLNGYDPSDNDKRCYDRLAERARTMGSLWDMTAEINKRRAQKRMVGAS
jgi:hypothetical protein